MVSGVAVRFTGVSRTLRWMGAVVALAAAACGNDTGAAGGGSNPPPGGQPPPSGTPPIGLGSSPTLGSYLISTADGRTLYDGGITVAASASLAST